MTDTTNDDRRHLVELVSDAKVAVLTTTTADGKRVSRPMGLQAGFDGDLWFFDYDDSAKVTQIKAVAEVNVSFSDSKNGSWTSIAGRAEIVRDRDQAEALYSDWEGPSSTVGFVIGTVRAAVTKNPDKDPISNTSVEL